MTQDGRQKALDTTLAQIRKRYGEGAIMRLGEGTGLEVDVIPTGCIALDVALGVGGIPKDESRKSMVQSPLARRRCVSTLLPSASDKVAQQRSSMLSTRWTRPMPSDAVLTLMNCIFLSRTRVNRLWRSQRHLCAAAPLTAL